MVPYLKRKILHIFLGLLLLILNAGLIWPLLKTGYTTQFGSFEATYIYYADYIFRNIGHLNWNHEWYSGFPFKLSYPPLIPYLLASLHFIFPEITIAHLYRLVFFASYICAPVTLYALVYYLSKKHYPSFIAALVFSIMPSLIYTNPDWRITAEFAGYAPWRLVVYYIYGEGPHNIGLAWLPLAALYYLKTLREGHYRNYLATAIFVSIIAITNGIALFAFDIMATVFLISEMLGDKIWIKLKRTFKAGLLTFGLTAFWYNFSFIQTTFRFATYDGKASVLASWIHITPLILLSLPFILMMLFLVFGKKPQYQNWLISLGLLGAFGTLVLSVTQFNLELGPQAWRYVPELDLCIAIFIGLGINYLQKIKYSHPFTKFFFQTLTKWLIIPAIIVLSANFLLIDKNFLNPTDNLNQTSEYRIAQYLNDHTNADSGRIFLTSTPSFWFNLFSPMPQLKGGEDFNNIHPWLFHASYQITHHDDALTSINWAKIFGVRYLVVNQDASKIAGPHDFQDPDKFENVLTKISAENGDAYYEIPFKYNNFIQPINLQLHQSLNVPKNGADADNIAKYVTSLEQNFASKVSYQWLNPDHLRLNADLVSGEGILLRQAYDANWKISSPSQGIELKSDVLGFQILEFDQPGLYTIDLVYQKSWDQIFGYIITIGTILYVIYRGIKKWHYHRVTQTNAISTANQKSSQIKTASRANRSKKKTKGKKQKSGKNLRSSII